MADEEKQYWLDKKRNVYKVVYGVYGLYLLFLVFDFLPYHRHPHFRSSRWFELSDERFGFYAVFGFGACLSLVFAAKLMRLVLMRDEDYYDE